MQSNSYKLLKTLANCYILPRILTKGNFAHKKMKISALPAPESKQMMISMRVHFQTKQGSLFCFINFSYTKFHNYKIQITDNIPK